MKKVFLLTILIFGLTAFLVTPFSVKALTPPDSYDNYSVEQLEALIVKLQKKLEELKKSSKCFIAEKDLSLGDGEVGENADEVRRLQNFLTEKGYFKYKATGYFGKITRAALLVYQKDAGVAQTGEFDLATRGKAHSLYCKTVKAVKVSKEEPKIEKKEEENIVSAVSNIVLKAGENANVLWATSGKSKEGFKVVWSKNNNPTYPTREGDKYLYFSESTANSATLEAFNGAGEYYVRVCEYLGGKCGVYSNQIKISL
ncbi:MAG: peptidoglycan-binding domain-containing protein [bacterium]|nr:peptidoglycan-binding domain-containing protein [bacterium]